MLTFEEFSTKMKALLAQMKSLGERSESLLARTKQFEEQVTTDAKLEELRKNIGNTKSTQ